MPQLGRVHSEGERIHYGPCPTWLDLERWPQAQREPPRTASQTWFEVLAATESTGFKMNSFRSVQAETTRRAW